MRRRIDTQLKERHVASFFSKPDGSPYKSIESAFNTTRMRAMLYRVSCQILQHTPGPELRKIHELDGERTGDATAEVMHQRWSRKLSLIFRRFSRV